jgi:hypothetical protein
MGRAYYFADIVIAAMSDGKRKTKPRTAVIIDNVRADTKGPFLLVSISSQGRDPCPYYHIKIHHSRHWDKDTGLSKPCWAKCNWQRDVKVGDIHERIGSMPDELMIRIVQMCNQLEDEGDSFKHWE